MKDFSFLFPFPSTFPFPSSSLYYTLSSSTRAGASSPRAASKSDDTDAAPISSFTWAPPTPTRTPPSQLPRTASKRPSLLSPSQSSSPLRFETRLIKASKIKNKKKTVRFICYRNLKRKDASAKGADYGFCTDTFPSSFPELTPQVVPLRPV